MVLQDNATIRDAGHSNIVSALRTALLLLPRNFTEWELYATLTELSYMRDLRMVIRELYGGLIRGLENVNLNFGCAGALEQDMDPVVRGDMVRLLPESFRTRLYRRYKAKLGVSRGRFNRVWGEVDECFRHPGDGSFGRRITGIDGLGNEIRETMEDMVRWPSCTCSVKSAVTAGVSRSWR